MINGTEFLRYQPGDGTSYDFVIVSDPYGGYLVVWPRNATYWVAKDASEYKFRHGNENKYTVKITNQTQILRRGRRPSPASASPFGPSAPAASWPFPCPSGRARRSAC